jgi:hypothetical protein
VTVHEIVTHQNQQLATVFLPVFDRFEAILSDPVTPMCNENATRPNA